MIAVAPLVSGLIKKIKNFIRMRHGAPVLQSYYNLSKLVMKEETVSTTTSWIFTVTPYVALGSTITALLVVPSLITGISMQYMGDFVAMIFILSLGRFFVALAGLDAGSSFGGMGSSREMFISAIVEPVALISVFAVSLNAGTTNLNLISLMPGMRLSAVLASISLLIITIAETARLPVDNQETHLELTMVHEAMILEYSGRSLALIELASYIKQILFFSVIAVVLFPATGVLMFILKLAGVCVIIPVIEISVAKLRLFRVPDLLTFSFIISCIAIVISSMGY
jgi:formate hydrogenlyase subunit 4